MVDADSQPQPWTSALEAAVEAHARYVHESIENLVAASRATTKGIEVLGERADFLGETQKTLFAEHASLIGHLTDLAQSLSQTLASIMGIAELAHQEIQGLRDDKSRLRERLEKLEAAQVRR